MFLHDCSLDFLNCCLCTIKDNLLVWTSTLASKFLTWQYICSLICRWCFFLFLSWYYGLDYFLNLSNETVLYSQYCFYMIYCAYHFYHGYRNHLMSLLLSFQHKLSWSYYACVILIYVVNKRKCHMCSEKQSMKNHFSPFPVGDSRETVSIEKYGVGNARRMGKNIVVQKEEVLGHLLINWEYETLSSLVWT